MVPADDMALAAQSNLAVLQKHVSVAVDYSKMEMYLHLLQTNTVATAVIHVLSGSQELKSSYLRVH